MPFKRLNYILLSVIALLVVVCFCQTRWLYLLLQRSVLGRITTTPTITVTSNAQPAVLLMGDSRVSQWNPLPDIPGCKMINLGQSGLTSSQLLFQLFQLEMPNNVKGAVIQIGINDLKAISLAPKQAGSIVSQCKANISMSVDCLRQRDLQVILMPVIPAGKKGLTRHLIWSDEVDSAVLEVNEYLETLRKTGVIIPECNKLWNTGGRLEPAHCLDALHLNQTGYQTLNEIIKPIMKDCFLQKESK